MMRAALAGVLILTVATGCDNVSWGGASIAIVRPPRQSGTPVTTRRASDEPRGPLVMPTGPVLYHVRVEGGTGRLEPIAEIVSDSLRALQPGQSSTAFADAFIGEHMREGAEFVLFHSGGRVGSFLVQAAGLEGGSACRPLPTATGVLELGPAAQGVTEFVAMSRADAPQDIGRANPPAVTRTMSVLGPILAERMMRSRRAGLPSDWQRAYAQVRPFPIEGLDNPAFTATFLVGDTLGLGLDDVGYSLFFVAEPVTAGYDTLYVSYRPYPETGKQAPRVIDYLDWNRDGRPELLLRVYGTTDSWLEALGRTRDGRWRRIWEDRCRLPGGAADRPPTLPPTAAPIQPPDTM